MCIHFFNKLFFVFMNKFRHLILFYSKALKHTREKNTYIDLLKAC